MSDKKISELPFGYLTPDSIIPIVTNCVTSQISFGDFISNITGFSSSDTFTTGGTYNKITGIATFKNNAGGTYTVSGFTISASTGSTPSLQQVLDYNHDLLNGKNFQGTSAGYGATNANYSNFLGQYAGYGATSANNSNFLGQYAGSGATGAEYSIFMGNQAGNTATNATYSNFIGNGAGLKATNAHDSNFLGAAAGYLATSAHDSNFIGLRTGLSATGASYSTFFGFHVGRGDTLGSVGSNNIIIGTNISLPSGTTNSINLGGVLFGSNTYGTTTGIIPSISAQTNGRIGINKVVPTTTLHIYSEAANTSGLRLERLVSSSPTSTGQAIGVDSSGNVVTISGGTGSTIPTLQQVLDNNHELINGKNFQGTSAGYGATSANNSNFIGNQAGNSATNAYQSNFFGLYAGYNATGASDSNFMGYSAGFQATNANTSNFLGSNAGYYATNSYQSNFFGYQAGYQATNARNSNFLGHSAGYNASGANNSNFLGYQAGSGSTGNNVNAFGASAGKGNTLNGQTIFSNTSLPSYADRSAATTAITVPNGASAGSTYLYYNEATFAIEGVRL